MSVLAGCGAPVSPVETERRDIPDVVEYCFPSRELDAASASTTPAYFLEKHPEALAAVNGVYWGADDGASQGVVYVRSVHHGSRKGLVSGYLAVRPDGAVSVGEVLADRVQRAIETSADEADFYVVGTHPLLVVAGAVHEQAVLDRYNVGSDGAPKLSMRTALGTKNGSDFCFAVSGHPITMNTWADLLVERGYAGAINLDGGPVAQLAVRADDHIEAYGQGVVETKLILFRRR